MRSALHEFVSGISSWHAARFALQATAAALITFALARLLGLTEASWAIISALFAVHATIGGSLSSALERVLGAAFGCVVGIVVLAAIGHGEWRAASRPSPSRSP